MLPLDDPRWQSYTGGYRTPFDASALLRQLFDRGASPELWDELWLQLHHQGDVGTASFAAVPWLLESARRSPELDWNAFGLIAVIELERLHYCGNRPMPAELEESYAKAIDRLPEMVQRPRSEGVAADRDAARHGLHCACPWPTTSGAGLP